MICGEILLARNGHKRVCLMRHGTEHTHDMTAPDFPSTRRLDRYECTYFTLNGDVEMLEGIEGGAA